MIILSEEDRQQLKVPPDSVPILRFPDRVAAGSTSSLHLPDYETSQRVTNQSQSISPTVESSKRQSRFGIRFWKTFLYALGIYVLLTLVLGIPFISLRLNDQFHVLGPPPPTSPRWPNKEPNTRPSSGQINLGNFVVANSSDCNQWSLVDDRPREMWYHARTNATFSPKGAFEILANLSANTHYPSLGNLTIDINSDPRVTQVLLEVDIFSSSKNLRSQTSVCPCLLGEAQGLHIYLPDDIPSKEVLHLDIKLLFPKATKTLEVKKLTTYLPTFSQYLGNLSPNIHFGEVSIAGGGFDIDIQSMTAREILVKSSLANVEGVFNVSEAIIIDNIEGHIHANATLFREPSRTGRPVFASFDTGSGAIDAAFTLQAIPKRSLIPRHFHSSGFSIDLKTFNAPIDASIFPHHSSSFVPTHIRVQNNLAPSRVTLDSKFTGGFDLQSKLSSAHIQEGQSLAGQFKYSHRTASRIHGTVGCENSCIGKVEMASSREPVELIFADAGTRALAN